MKPRVFFQPAIVLPLGDGSFRVAAGKPVERLSMEQACQMAGLRPKDLRRMVEEGLIHAQRPAPRRWSFAAEELAMFLRFTETHPDFWNNPKTRLLWQKQNPFSAEDVTTVSASPVLPAQGDLFA